MVVRVTLGLALLVAVGCEASRCAGICLGEPRRTSWGVVPGVMRWVDVDGDGHADLVVASPAQGTVSVAWGADTVLGETATTWSVAVEVAGLEVADVDSDGLLDLVTAVPADDEVAVLRGRGGREFAEAVRLMAGAEPRGVLATQLDGGGALELVTVNAGDGTVRVLGEAVRSTVVGPEPRDVAAGDLDGDGDVDLAVALAGAAAVQVLLGDGAGGLMPGELHPVGGAPHAVVMADLDGDGALDLASADTLADRVSVVFGDGAGAARAQRVWDVDPEPRALATVVRAGQPPALAVLSSGTGSVQVIEPTSGARVAGATGTTVTGIAAGDVDGVPGEEVIYGDSSRFGVLRSGVGVQVSGLWEGPLDHIRAFSADLEGDGIDELFVEEWAETLGTTEIVVLAGGVAVQTVAVEFPDHVAFVGAGDFTGDGRRDVLAASGARAMLLVQESDGTLVPSGSLELTGATAWAIAGDDDRAVAVMATDGALVLWVAGPDGQFFGAIEESESALQAPVWTATVDGAIAVALARALWLRDGAEWRRVDDGTLAEDIRGGLAGDFQGDAASDAVFCTRNDVVFVADVKAEGRRAPRRLGEEGCVDLASGDVNGDGVLDVLVLAEGSRGVTVTPWVYAAGEWSAWAGQAIPRAEWTRFARLDADGIADVVTFGRAAQIKGWRVAPGAALLDAPLRRFEAAGAVVGDVNADGLPDVLLYGRSLAVGFGDGDAGFEPFVHSSRQSVLPEWEGLTGAAMLDVERDGRMEVLVAGRRLTDWGTDVALVRVDDAGRMVAEKLTWIAGRGVRIVAGDFDGDEVTDAIAAASGVLYWLDGAAGFRAEAVQFASLSLGAIAAADVDGDGRLDLVGTADNDILVFHGRGDGELDAGEVWLSAAHLGLWALGDVDRDHRLDAVVARDSLTLWRGGAAPRWLLGGIVAAAVGDLDADGQPELLAASEDTLHVGRSAGDAVFAFSATAAALVDPRLIFVDEFDGDERRDVAVMNPARGVTVLRGVP